MYRYVASSAGHRLAAQKRVPMAQSIVALVADSAGLRAQSKELAQSVDTSFDICCQAATAAPLGATTRAVSSMSAVLPASTGALQPVPGV